MKGINKTIDKKLALMHDTIGKVKHLRHGRCARMGGVNPIYLIYLWFYAPV
jgi:hypothetical protein